MASRRTRDLVFKRAFSIGHVATRPANTTRHDTTDDGGDDGDNGGGGRDARVDASIEQRNLRVASELGYARASSGGRPADPTGRFDERQSQRARRRPTAASPRRDETGGDDGGGRRRAARTTNRNVRLDEPSGDESPWLSGQRANRKVGGSCRRRLVVMEAINESRAVESNRVESRCRVDESRHSQLLQAVDRRSSDPSGIANTQDSPLPEATSLAHVRRDRGSSEWRRPRCRRRRWRWSTSVESNARDTRRRRWRALAKRAVAPCKLDDASKSGGERAGGRAAATASARKPQHRPTTTHARCRRDGGELRLADWPTYRHHAARKRTDERTRARSSRRRRRLDARVTRADEK